MKAIAHTLTILATALILFSFGGTKASAATETWTAYYTTSVRTYTPAKNTPASWQTSQRAELSGGVFWFGSQGHFVWRQYSADWTTIIDELTGTCAKSGSTITFKINQTFSYGYSGQTVIVVSGKATLSGNNATVSISSSAKNLTATTVGGSMSYSSSSAYTGVVTITRFY